MTVARQIICTLLLLYMNSYSLTSQSVIQGVVSDEQGTPIDACVVFLLHKSSMLLADHTLTGVDGQYQVAAPESGEYILELNNLSFWDTAFQVKADGQSIIMINASLRAKVYDLQVVEVIDKLLGIRRSGDTLFYNIHAYTDGSEMLVEDLLKKLPGINISPSGQISYMGKTVDALLLDGNDLTGSRHADITQNFQSDNVGRVQVIENYIGEFDAHSLTGELEKVAMNIEIKKDRNGTTVGNLAAGAGYHERYVMKINAVRSNPRQGFSLFAGSTNHERDPHTEEAVTAYFQNWAYNIGTQRFGFIDYELYSDRNLDGRFSEHFLRITETNRMNPVWSRRTFIDVTGGQSMSLNQNSTMRFADESTEESYQSQINKNLSIHLDHDTKIQVSPTWKVFAKAEGRMIIPLQTLTDTGNVDGLAYSLKADSDKRLLQFNLEGLAEWSLHELHTLKVFANYNHISSMSEWSIVADDTLFGYSTPEVTGKHIIKYHDQYGQNLRIIGAEWIWSPAIAEFAVFGKQTLLNEDLQVLFRNPFLQEREECKVPVYEAGFKTTFTINNLKVNGDITLARSDSDKNTKNVQYHVLPSIKIRHDIGKKSVLSLQVLRQEWSPALLYLHKLPMILDHRTLASYESMVHQYISGWNASLFLQKKPGDYKNAFIANLSASWSDKTLVTQERVEKNYFLRSASFLPPNSTYRLMMIGWHTADDWKLNVNQFLIHTAGHSVLGDSDVKQTNLWSRTVLEFAFKGFDGYELSASPQVQFQQQHIGEIVTNWINPIFSIAARHKGSTWEFTFDISQNINQSQDQSLKVQILNFSIGYRKLMPFRIYIEGTDVLNLVSNQSLTAIINPVIAETILSERLPGSILLIGRYDF